MLFRDRPLLPDGLDAQLYLARPELENALLSPLRAGRNVLLLGDPGSGKSTILRKTASSLEQENRPTALVNGAVADDALELLELIEGALEERLPAADPSMPTNGHSAGTRLLRASRRLGRYEPTVIIIDDLVDADIGFDLFGRLRDELWGLDHIWAVAVRPRDSGALRTPPADAFWARVVEIPPLSSAESEELLRRGVSGEEYRALEVEGLVQPQHPRYVIRWAQSSLEPNGPISRRQLSPQWHLEQASKLGRSEAMAVMELYGLGRPVSAHDPELLERLGWSRPYAQRILSNLENHALLRSVPERRDGPGRPRKLYELNPSPRQA